MGLAADHTKYWKELNASIFLPYTVGAGQPVALGCNYHTTWQRDKGMRFVLVEIKNGKARLKTRATNKDFWTPKHTLIFITTKHNKKKAEKFRPGILQQ